MVPTTRSESSIGTERAAGCGGADPVDPGLSPSHRRPGPAEILDHERRHWASGRLDHPGEPVPIEPFAAERHEGHGADVRVGAQLLQHPLGVPVRIAAAEADDVSIVATRGDRLRNRTCALDEVDDRDGVADADPAVGTLVAQDRGRGGAAQRSPPRCAKVTR